MSTSANALLKELPPSSLRFRTATAMVRVDRSIEAQQRSYACIEGTPSALRFLAQLLLETAERANESDGGCSVVLNPEDSAPIDVREWSAIEINAHPELPAVAPLEVEVRNRAPSAAGRDRCVVQLRSRCATPLQLREARYETEGVFSVREVDVVVPGGGIAEFDLEIPTETGEMALWMRGHAATPGRHRIRGLGMRSSRQPLPPRREAGE